MVPGEAPERVRRGWTARYAWLLGRCILVFVVYWGVVLVIDADERQHVLGGSESTHIEIHDSVQGDMCAKRKHSYEINYVLEGEDRVRTMQQCLSWSPLQDRTYRVWTTDSGDVRFDSPSMERGWIVVLPFFVALLLLSTPLGRYRRVAPPPAGTSTG